ncbi:hypothetical protein EVG20_g9803 [Dentipellis fragilis]|uniref:DUF985 domain-containing protein n=1 Tax=Dentipellis fragilis TaxID=205917 RepID=A0A4Y9XVP8_9AGAM|nr:hypothetical protein EVG20_g9803 [Dentipellis fragilis]
MSRYTCNLSTNAELIAALSLTRHSEGGYFAETDRQDELVPSPYAVVRPDGQLRSVATSIFYLLTYDEPNGVFHTNRSVTYHILHHGRVEYTLIAPGNPPRIERVIMGANVAAGERRQLIVGGGVWKMSKIPKADLVGAKSEEEKARAGCLITEVVTPGFQWEDHQFLTKSGLQELFQELPGVETKMLEFLPYIKKSA